MGTRIGNYVLAVTETRIGNYIRAHPHDNTCAKHHTQVVYREQLRGMKEGLLRCRERPKL